MTTEKLMELFHPMNPEKVAKLGDRLGLPQYEIDRIEKDYQSPTQRKEALPRSLRTSTSMSSMEPDSSCTSLGPSSPTGYAGGGYLCGRYTKHTVVRLWTAY